MKRPTYNQAIRFVAENDEPSCMFPFKMKKRISVLMVASLFATDPSFVAKDIIQFRYRRMKQ